MSGDHGVMKKEMMAILACPVCKADLDLEIESANGDEIMSGTLTCKRLGETYQIEDGAPNLLPPEYRTPSLSSR